MATRYADLAMFLAVAEHLSFQRAAISRGVTRSAVSHAIRALEAQLSLRLVQRTTRSVALTEAGRLLRDRLPPAFAEIDRGLEELNSFRDAPYGTIRVTAPSMIARRLTPAILELAAENPGLNLEVSGNDALVDIVAEGFDAGIRFGEQLQQDMIAVRIGLTVDFAVVAAPSYLASAPPVLTPRDLLAHPCIHYRFPSGVLQPWEFEKDGQELSITVQGPLTLNDHTSVIEAAEAGAGLAYLPSTVVNDLVGQGRLVRMLGDCTPRDLPLFLYYANRAHISAALRAVIERFKRLQ